MSGDSQDIKTADPLEVTKHATDTNGEFVRFETTVHPSFDAEGTDLELEHERYLIDNPDEHIHPQTSLTVRTDLITYHANQS